MAFQTLRTIKWMFLTIILMGFLASDARAIVDVDTWVRPPAVLLSPRVENIRLAKNFGGKARTEYPVDRKVRRDDYEGKLLVVLPWTETFVAGVELDHSAGYLRWPQPPCERLYLKQFSAKLTAGFMPTPNDMIMTQIGGGYFPGGRHTFSDSFSPMFVTYWLHAFSETFAGVVGLAVTENLTGYAPTPLLGFAWQPNEDFRWDGILPGFMLMTWHFQRPYFFFTRFLAGANPYHVKERVDFTRSDWPETFSNEVEYTLIFQEAQLISGLGYQINEAVSLEAGGGLLLGRIFQADLPDGVEIKAKTRSTWTLRFQLSVRL